MSKLVEASFTESGIRGTVYMPDGVTPGYGGFWPPGRGYYNAACKWARDEWLFHKGRRLAVVDWPGHYRKEYKVKPIEAEVSEG